MVRVHLWSSIRRLAGGQAEVDLPAGSVAQILAALVEAHPGLQPFIKAGVSVVVNGEVLPSRHAEVADGAEMHLLQPMRGG